MAYPQRLSHGLVPSTTVANLSPLLLTAAATTYAKWVCTRPVMVKQLLFYVTTATSTATAATIRLKKHLAYGVSASQVSICALVVPNGATVGQVIYKNFSPVQVNAGDEVCIDVVNAGTDPGTAQGAGFCDVVFDLEPSDPADQSDMTASA